MSQPFDEEHVRLLLDGSPDEVKDGITLIHLHLRRGILGYVRKKYPGLTSEDLEDVWAEVIKGILQNKNFDLDKPLIPWLCMIAYRRAADRVRRQDARDRLVDAVASSLSNTREGDSWGRLDACERRELMELIHKAISRLPFRQKLIMEVFVNDFPDTTSMPELQRLVSERSRKPETSAAVKRALQEGRAKVREFLGDKGYNFGKQGEL